MSNVCFNSTFKLWFKIFTQVPLLHANLLLNSNSFVFTCDLICFKVWNDLWFMPMALWPHTLSPAFSHSLSQPNSSNAEFPIDVIFWSLVHFYVENPTQSKAECSGVNTSWNMKSLSKTSTAERLTSTLESRMTVPGRRIKTKTVIFICIIPSNKNKSFWSSV